MDKKSLARLEVKDETKGEVEAVFATLDVVDKDGDITRKGAFENGAEVVISAYNHKSWEGALPVGMGTISEQGDKVIMKGQFFLNTSGGRDTFEVVKALGGKGEWSYGFNVDDSAPTEIEGKSVRELRKMTVHEVSPVMRGAGVGTMTTYAKSFKDEIAEATDVVTKAIQSAKRVVALRAENGKSLSTVTTASLDGLRESIKALSVILNTQEETTEDTTQDDELNAIALDLIAASLESE